MRIQDKIYFILLISVIFFTVQCSAENENKFAGLFEEKFYFEGKTRHILINIPPQINNGEELPLVLLFHGGLGNAKQAAEDYGFIEKSNKEGFLLVAPYGSGRLEKSLLTWNVYFGFGYAKRFYVNDLGFIEKLLERLERRFNIAQDRIFATGISNGAIFCHFLAGKLSHKIAAIAPVVGTAAGKEIEKKEFIWPETPKYPVSVIAFNGLLDKSIPLAGGKQQRSIANPVWVASAKDSCLFWAKNNGCSLIANEKLDLKKKYREIAYFGGKSNSVVVQYEVLNQGHAWPGTQKKRKRADAPSSLISATDLIWRFFCRHPKEFAQDNIASAPIELLD